MVTNLMVCRCKHNTTARILSNIDIDYTTIYIHIIILTIKWGFGGLHKCMSYEATCILRDTVLPLPYITYIYIKCRCRCALFLNSNESHFKYDRKKKIPLALPLLLFFIWISRHIDLYSYSVCIMCVHIYFDAAGSIIIIIIIHRPFLGEDLFHKTHKYEDRLWHPAKYFSNLKFTALPPSTQYSHLQMLSTYGWRVKYHRFLLYPIVGISAASDRSRFSYICICIYGFCADTFTVYGHTMAIYAISAERHVIHGFHKIQTRFRVLYGVDADETAITHGY